MALPSDAPVRPPGVRARSGNAMTRTREALLVAAADCVQRLGVRRTTMGEVAATAGVAKATLYNHLRTKDDVLRALVEAQVAALGDRCRETAAREGLVAALVTAAAGLAESGPLRRVADEEPALLAPLAAVGDGRGGEQARAAVTAVLEAAGADPGSTELVLRWLLSQLWWPLTGAEQSAQAARLAAVLPTGVPLVASAVPGAGRPRSDADAGLGWPMPPPTRNGTDRPGEDPGRT